MCPSSSLARGNSSKTPPKISRRACAGGIGAPAPHRPDELGVAGQDVRDVGAVGGVQVQRHVQVLGTCPDHPQRRVVEIAALGVRVDQGPAQPELGDRPVQFLRRRLAVLQRECGEPGEAVGLGGDDLGQVVVDPAAAVTATLGSGSAWMPGALSESTAMSRPAASIIATRSPVMSSSRRLARSQMSGGAIAALEAP